MVSQNPEQVNNVAMKLIGLILGNQLTNLGKFNVLTSLKIIV